LCGEYFLPIRRYTQAHRQLARLSPSAGSKPKENQMTTFELIAYSGAAILFLACAFKITSAKTLTLRLSSSGIEIKAEGSRPPQPQAKIGG
jgi:hypothetical protein